MRRWSRGRLAVPESLADVRGWESRASIWVGFVVVAVAWEVDGWLVVGWVGEGSAGGVSGWDGDGGGRVVGDAILRWGGSRLELWAKGV
jgi:hypothetical protein